MLLVQSVEEKISIT